MCGICGIIGFPESDRAIGVRSMMMAMKHRGPDDEGIFQEEKICLGFVRLSIIDLSSAGHQPMASLDGRYVLVFNGELYNYIELRQELVAKGITFRTRTDAEVLLAAFQEWGEACLGRFNGMWAFSIYDRHEHTLFCARDRFGVKPFYYLQTKTAFVFASEIPPLLTFLKSRPQANETAIYNFLVYNRTDQDDTTFFTGIHKLRHGHALKIWLGENGERVGDFKIHKWYDLRTNLKEPYRTPEEFREALRSSIDLRLRSDVPIGVCLSGGLDSSSIVSILLNDFQQTGVNTFSAVYGLGQSGDESDYINLFRGKVMSMHVTSPTAESLKADVTSFLRAIGEPVPTPSPYAQYKVMELAKGKVVVTLDGQGADEELAGYLYFFGFYFKELLCHGRWPKLAAEIAWYYSRHRSAYGLKALAYFMLPSYMRSRLREKRYEYLKSDFIDRNRKNSTISSNLYGSQNLQEALLNHFEFKLEHLLKWEDRNSMAFSLEARVPFLDYRLVEKTLSLPADQVIRKGMNKHILREAMRGILPEPIRVRRDKIGFDTPMNEWFTEKGWQEFVISNLLSSTFLRDILDVNWLIEDYKNERGAIAKDVWKALALHIWNENVVQASSAGGGKNVRLRTNLDKFPQ